MDDEHERLALVAVRARLGERFPEVDAAVVEAAVRLAHAELTGPVRDFVPLLVERAARDRLAFASRDPDRVDAGTPAGAGAPPAAAAPLTVDEPA